MGTLKKRIAKIAFEKIDYILHEKDKLAAKAYIDNFRDCAAMSEVATEHMKCMGDLLMRLLESGGVSPKESTLIPVFLYLLMVEGAICNFLNLISYLLVTTGHDLYSLSKRKYVKENIEEITKVEMSTKMQFLKVHGFGALTKEHDSALRNDIAHHNIVRLTTTVSCGLEENRLI